MSDPSPRHGAHPTEKAGSAYAAYHVRLSGHLQGPFELEELHERYERGLLSRFHEVSPDLETWTPLGEFWPAVETGPGLDTKAGLGLKTFDPLQPIADADPAWPGAWDGLAAGTAAESAIEASMDTKPTNILIRSILLSAGVLLVVVANLPVAADGVSPRPWWDWPAGDAATGLRWSLAGWSLVGASWLGLAWLRDPAWQRRGVVAGVLVWWLVTWPALYRAPALGWVVPWWLIVTPTLLGVAWVYGYIFGTLSRRNLRPMIPSVAVAVVLGLLVSLLAGLHAASSGREHLVRCLIVAAGSIAAGSAAASVWCSRPPEPPSSPVFPLERSA